MEPYILDFRNPRVDLATAGGKGASLSRLTRAGLPVPPGFIITTSAYDAFIARHDLGEAIGKAAAKNPGEASKTITALIKSAAVPEEISQPILTAYHELTPRGKEPVAVRSSATAEDLPEASFAGQQDTFLNVRGETELLDAVKNCWASLWSERALDYRNRRGFLPGQVSLAVVVQKLIPARAAGILFTVNPLSCRSDEMVINSSWGLGEAVVGGLVTPDTYTLEKESGRITRRRAADKQIMTVRCPSGTRETPTPERLRRRSSLSKTRAAELADLGKKIESLYKTPMDIEWALAGRKIALLQARPITTLQEEPVAWSLPRKRGVYMRSSVVDLMPAPLSPLYATLGLPSVVKQLGQVARTLTGRKPSLPKDYFTVINTYAYMDIGFSLRDWSWILFGLLPAYPRMLKRLVPYWREEALPRYEMSVRELKESRNGSPTPEERWTRVKQLTDAAGLYTGALMFATMGASAGSEAMLTRLYEKMVRRDGDPEAAALLLGWDTTPLKAEKHLYQTAETLRRYGDLTGYLIETETALTVAALAGESPPASVSPEAWEILRRNLFEYRMNYGHMLFQLDFAEPLPADFSEPLIEAVKMYLREEGTDPEIRRSAAETLRRQTEALCLGRLRGLRLRIFRKVLRWAQSLSEVREEALAALGLAYPHIRQELLTLGSLYKRRGLLEKQEDIFFLTAPETEAAALALTAEAPIKPYTRLIAERKKAQERFRRAVPPPMLPPRKKVMGFDTGLFLAGSDENARDSRLTGVAAGTGTATAPACVMTGPEDFGKMKPGAVIVAPTTSPAWTPLFAMASAVVTDIGGPLSHGSIVAREYGIPAVMGTGTATRRIASGQIITVDGDAGAVWLEPDSHEPNLR